MLCLCVGEMPVSEMLLACWSVGSQVIRAIRVKSDNLSVCHDVMRRERSSSSSLMTRAEADAFDGNDIGSVKKVRANYARGGSTPSRGPKSLKNKVMRIRISDKSLRDGELTLEVSNFLTTSQEMFFDLDNRWLGDFIATAVAKGMVKSAFRKDGGSNWAITMDVKYLTGLIYEA